MVDDSIVRGTTSRRIVQLLRDAGAVEVHLRISSPPVKYPCYFGIDTPSRKQLPAASKSVEEICDMIGTDSLGYLSLEGMLSAVKMPAHKYCVSCWVGRYPFKGASSAKNILEKKCMC